MEPLSGKDLDDLILRIAREYHRNLDLDDEENYEVDLDARSRLEQVRAVFEWINEEEDVEGDIEVSIRPKDCRGAVDFLFDYLCVRDETLTTLSYVLQTMADAVEIIQSRDKCCISATILNLYHRME